jgi:23S rRNA pseudouridine2605 synthase
MKAQRFQRTVTDLLGDRAGGIFPVGRLDRDTEGLLLLTNDGELALRMTHPRYGLEKEYHVEVTGRPDEETVRTLRRGVVLDGRRTAPARVSVLRETDRGGTWLRVTIREGRKRQVRRMLEAVGHPVRRLIRVRVGPLKLGHLPLGRVRELRPAELDALMTATGLQGTAARRKPSPVSPA